MLKISDSLIDKILQEAEKIYPYEACGILLGLEETDKKTGQRKIVREVHHVDNFCENNSQDRYEIRAEDFLAVDRLAQQKGWEILGFYHSHPQGQPLPSSVDAEKAWTWYSYFIVSLGTNGTSKIKSWVWDEQQQEFTEELVEIVE